MNERVYYSQEAEMRAKRERFLIAVMVMALGALAGALIALLFAPKTGHDTRRNISHLFGDSIESGRDATGSALQRLEHQFSELRKLVEERLPVR